MTPETRALVDQLHQDPHDVNVLRALRSALDDGKHGSELARVLEWWVTYAPDDQTASRALLDAARALRSDESEEPHVLSLLTTALFRDPSNEQAAVSIRQMLEQAGDHHELEPLLTEWALAVRRDGCPATLCAMASFMLAHVRAHSLDDIDGGISALEDALRAFAEHPDAKRALAELYARRSRTRRRADDPRAREDAHRAAQLYFELGTFDIGEAAIKDFLRALDLVPQHSASIEALLRRVGVSNLELMRKRLSAYVALSPDRVRTHRHRFELVRYLFRERRYAEAVPHLRYLANRGYADARRILERLCPEVHTEATAPALAGVPTLTLTLPALPIPPIYDNDELTKTDASRLTPADTMRSVPALSAPVIDEHEPTVVVPNSSARARLTEIDLLADNDNATYEDLVTCEVSVADLVDSEEEEEGRPTEILDSAVREAVLKAAMEVAAEESKPRLGLIERAVARNGARRVERVLGFAVVAVTSAVAITSYMLGFGH